MAMRQIHVYFIVTMAIRLFVSYTLGVIRGCTCLEHGLRFLARCVHLSISQEPEFQDKVSLHILPIPYFVITAALVSTTFWKKRHRVFQVVLLPIYLAMTTMCTAGRHKQ